jgi:hypothetical protein
MTPKISLNKLGEYLEANPGRRRRIVFDAKNPAGFIVTRYRDAKTAVKEYFISKFDTNIIHKSIDDHELKSIETDFQEQDRNLSIELLKAVLGTVPPDLSEYTITSYNGINPKLSISDVNVSVYPDLIIRGSYKGKDVVGAIKIQTSKTNSLGEEGGLTVTTLLREFVENNVANENEKAELSLCISYDIFAQFSCSAPKAYKRRMKQIESACEEIALWWEKV